MLALWIVSVAAVVAVELYAFMTIVVLHRTEHTSPGGKWVLGSIFLVFGFAGLFLAGRVLSILGGGDPMMVGRWLASIRGEAVAVLALVSFSALAARVVHYVSTQEGEHGREGARA